MPGKRGNKNALKHGFYAHLWTDDERTGLKRAGDVNDITSEIHLIRVQIRRLAEAIEIAKKPDALTLSAFNTLTLALSSLSTLIRTNLLASGDLPETETAILDALAQFRQEQGL